MNAESSDPAAPATEIHAVLIALQGDSLLLPSLAVAEVLPPERLQPRAAPPAWHVGDIEWQGLNLPVVRLETLNGDAGEADPRRTRLLILRMPSSSSGLPAIAVLSQGYPHLVTLKREAVTPEELRDTDRSDLLLARLRIGNQSAWVPDFLTLLGQLQAPVAP